MPARFVGPASISKFLLLLCLVAILQNTVIIFHQLYDIHHKSPVSRTDRLTRLAYDKPEKSSNHFNPFIIKRKSLEDEGEEKWNEKNLIRVLRTDRHSTQTGRKVHGKKIDQLTVRTVTEKKIDQLAVRTVTEKKIDQLAVRTVTEKKIDQLAVRTVTEKKIDQLAVRTVTEKKIDQLAVRTVTERKMDQLAVRTVTEKKMHQPAENWKDNTTKQKVFIPKTSAVGTTHARTNFTPVLILAYFRSGSSWLGNMIRQSDRTFYVLEPFKLYQKQSYYNVGNICYNNNTCRTSVVPSDKHGFALFALQQLFNCRFERLAPKIVSQVTQEFQARDLTPCTDARWNSTKCINHLKRKCFESSHRLIRTIRISMSIVMKLAELMPRLKVIHLLRDPRAITHSRKKGYFSMSYDVISQTKTLCTRIEEDVNIANKLKAKHRGKIVTVIYEALAEYPDTGIQFLYNFLQLPLDMKTFSSMEMTSIGPVNNGNHKIYKKESAQIAYRWRSKMTFNITRIIDNICARVYSIIGYVAINLESDLNDTEFLTRNTNPLNDDSWFQ